MRDKSTETTVQTTTEILNTHKHKHKQPFIGQSDDKAATSIGKSAETVAASIGKSDETADKAATSIGKSADTDAISIGKSYATFIGMSLVQETPEYRERDPHNPEPTGESNTSIELE